MILQIERLGDDVPRPKYATSGSAAFDLTNQIGFDIVLQPGETVIIPTGLKVKLPANTVGFVSSRSGISLKGFRVANAPGVIDEDYRNEVGVIASNGGRDNIRLGAGDRIAQFTVLPYIRCDLMLVDAVDVEEGNERGLGGFGSTGAI